MNDASHDNQERRQFFRIDDTLALSWVAVAPNRIGAVMEQLRREEDLGVAAEETFAALSRRAEKLRRVQEPEIRALFELVEQRLEMLADRMLHWDRRNTRADLQQVNLSAGGVAFRTVQPVLVGECMVIRLGLLEMRRTVFAGGRVVRSQEDAPGQWWVAVAFQHIREEDQQKVLQYTLHKQSLQIKAQQKQGE
ncbi:PilZ domain-containing protein [Alkalilimnicola ehrlichii MLHE-1]|uniref:Type IV pilus assembly PilZ n=1 Tax=Alkalilimnicola ehrlichii (strain ATCC BAA-1101 / DSM 17681 / MLHE-1) TaxID=187272 RepID=Q0A7J9_ALKEH|nr:PilZ domain-containing protein [Alkalilimnicola ehrlichii]ABI57188.1 type IV pilus assembly PilZ [Alkalilimnicola ehrlichii MLHE-1]